MTVVKTESAHLLKGARDAIVDQLRACHTKDEILRFESWFNSETNSSSSQRETSSLVQKNELIKEKTTKKFKSEHSQFIPTDISQNAIEKYKELTKLFSGDPDDRLSAILIASDWDNPKAIKFLKRGLKDFDSRVVIASAKGISNFKGKTTNIKLKVQEALPPLNVFLMR